MLAHICGLSTSHLKALAIGYLTEEFLFDRMLMLRCCVLYVHKYGQYKLDVEHGPSI
jgi:hypothetical protein